MKIQAIDLRKLEERTPLHEVVPLSTPFSLYIEPTSHCNLRCLFCPTGYKEYAGMRPNGLMDYDLFCKIVDDIKEFDRKLKRVNLYKDGEPLVNKRFPDMVRYLKAANVVDTIWTKTNGVLLNPALNADLASCGLDFIGISVNHVSGQGYKDITQRRIDYDKFVENITDLYTRRRTFQIYIKIADSGLTDDELQKFHDDFTPISDFIAVEKLHGWSASETMDFRLGTRADTFEGNPLVEKIACPLPFFMLGINWNGTVSLCNEDWAHQTLVGNLKWESLKEVWNGKRLRAMRRMHLEGKRGDNTMCGACHYLTTLPDNIDPHREEMLKKI